MLSRRHAIGFVPSVAWAFQSLNRIANVNEFEALAKSKISSLAFDFLAGGSSDDLTLRLNREAWSALRLKPRALVDVSRIETGLTLFGQRMAHPILFAPTAYHKLFHPDGEIESVRGAAAAQTTLVASTFATVAIEEMTRTANTPIWFQLYMQRDRAFSKALIQRAEAAGCTALVMTVDQPVRGYRDRDIRNAFALPAGMERANLRGLSSGGGAVTAENDIYHPAQDPTAQWRDVEWLRSLTKLPIAAKGIMTPEDAQNAVKAGVNGIIVSNHGARSLDGVPATAEVLEGVIDSAAGRVPVLVDGGIRRGTDVLKALALGAQAVLIGRPYVYALAAAGSVGIARAMEILTMELRMAMALAGRPTLASIDRTLLWKGPPYR